MEWGRGGGGGRERNKRPDYILCSGFCVFPVCLDELILAARCSSVPFTQDVVFVLWRVGAIPGNGCVFQGQNYVAMF